ncbi:MFS transporter [Rhizorhabdus argentea]|uniref:MFS transporter n=1 Tax=Rhizorhabdus argentea TaxID=1387174 RepID=UPI0030EB652E
MHQPQTVAISAGAPGLGPALPADPRSPVSKRFMFAYALAQYTAWLAILTPVIMTIALKVSKIASAAEKGVYLSTILAIGAFGALVAAPIWGAISDRTRARVGRRKLWMALGCLSLLVGLSMMALSTRLLGLAIGWLICQIGFNACQAPLNALMPDVVPTSQQGRMSALLGITANLAFVSAAFITQFTSGNSLAMFLVPWLPYPFALAFLMASFRDRPASSMPPFSAADLVRTFWVNPIRYPDFAWAFVSRFLLFFASAFFMTYQLYFLTDRIGVSKDAVLHMMFLCTLVTTMLTLILTPISGWFSDRLGRRKPLVFFAGIVASAGLLAIGGATTFGQFLVCAAIYGTGIAVYSAVDIALCVAVLPDPDDAAKDMAVMQIANSLPQSLAPAAAPLFLAIGAAQAPNYPAVFIAASIFGVIGASAVLPIRKSR